MGDLYYRCVGITSRREVKCVVVAQKGTVEVDRKVDTHVPGYTVS